MKKEPEGLGLTKALGEIFYELFEISILLRFADIPLYLLLMFSLI